jgi:5-methylcytosine-specific restriction endonuclease McrA
MLLDSAKHTRKLESRTKITYTNLLVIGNTKASVFYNSPEWQRLRYSAIEKYGNRCAACGRSPKDGVVIHVDHIKPRSLNPELALDIDNLQILCEPCNVGKSNKFSKDWR